MRPKPAAEQLLVEPEATVRSSHPDHVDLIGAAAGVAAGILYGFLTARLPAPSTAGVAGGRLGPHASNLLAWGVEALVGIAALAWLRRGTEPQLQAT